MAMAMGPDGPVKKAARIWFFESAGAVVAGGGGGPARSLLDSRPIWRERGHVLGSRSSRGRIMRAAGLCALPMVAGIDLESWYMVLVGKKKAHDVASPAVGLPLMIAVLAASIGGGCLVHAFTLYTQAFSMVPTTETNEEEGIPPADEAKPLSTRIQDRLLQKVGVKDSS